MPLERARGWSWPVPGRWLWKARVGRGGRTDYTPAVLVVPVRATVDLGPVYVRGGALAGVRFPTRNSELWYEEAPDIFDSPSNTNFWSVEAAVGASF